MDKRQPLGLVVPGSSAGKDTFASSFWVKVSRIFTPRFDHKLRKNERWTLLFSPSPFRSLASKVEQTACGSRRCFLCTRGLKSRFCDRKCRLGLCFILHDRNASCRFHPFFGHFLATKLPENRGFTLTGARLSGVFIPSSPIEKKIVDFTRFCPRFRCPSCPIIEATGPKPACVAPKMNHLTYFIII